ncbi:MAG: hypothetical protein JWO08_1818 [Verrucomicrobiaceae bacterium]|nr:hypothetical protein [Verrucomicrobiaceae bacterium]
MKPRDIARLRLAHHHISAPGKTAAEVVASLVAMQAQDYLGALWSVGLRTAQATEATITEAIADRQIVRTWPMRGTLHFVAAADVRWLLALLTPRIIASAAGRHRKLGLDAEVFARSRKLLIKALEGGQSLSRDTLYQVLESGGIATNDQRGYHILWRLAQEGLICCASHMGKQPAFALLDQWVPAHPVMDRETSLGTLALRYFEGHGPATLADFVWWSGLKISDARKALEMVASKLVKEEDFWMGAEASSAKTTRSAHLLPCFDECLLGYTDRSAVLDPQHAAGIIAGGMFLPTVVVHGQVIGTWRRALKGKEVRLAMKAFADAPGKAVEAAAQRYGDFLGLPVVLV